MVAKNNCFHVGLIGAMFLLSLVFPHSVRATGFVPSSANLAVLGTNGVSIIVSGEAASKAKGTDFGVCAPGVLYTNTLYLLNNGTGPTLNFSSIVTNGSGFTIAGIPMSVAYNDTVPFTVVYGSATSGSNTADLVLNIQVTAVFGTSVNNGGPTAYTIKLAGSVGSPVFDISTNCGPFVGGNTITITNGSFGNITNVLVGGVSATLGAHGATWFTITLPATGSAGVKDIVVQTSDNGDITLADAYTVNPAGAIGWAGSITNWTEVSSMPAARRFFGAASDANKLLIFGGLQGQTYQNNTYSFDGTTWTTESGTLGASVGFNSGGTLRGVIYSMGGKNASTVLTNVWKWTGSIWVEVAGLPSARWGGAAATLNDTLYYMGGRDAGNVSTTNVYAFDGTNWTEVAGLPAPRHVLLGTSLGSRIYAMGGYDDFGSCLNVFVFDGISWTEGAPLPEANTEFAAFSLYNYMYTVGGFSGGTRTNVFRFDGETWEQAPGLPNARHALGAAFLNGFGYAVAGAYDGVSKTNVYRASWEYAGGVRPVSGLFTGGYEVTINGVNLGNGSDITNVTLGGVSAEIQSQSATQIVVTAGISGLATLGDVRVFSTSFGETVKGQAFEYLRSAQSPLVFSPASPQAVGSTNALSVSGGSGTGAVSYAVVSGPGQIVGSTNLEVTGSGGPIQVQARKAQDALYFEACVTAEVAVAVAKGDQTITFGNPGDQLITNRLTLAGTASSGLPVSYEVKSGPAALSDLSNLTFTAGGMVVLAASQAGDSSWNAATTITQSFKVWPVLTVKVAPDGTGDTTPAPGDYRVTVNVATAIQASAHAGYHFTGWTQAGGGEVANASALSTTVTLSSNSTVTANFTLNVITAQTDQAEATVPEGGLATFRVKLSAQGTGDVVVAVARESGDSSLSVTNGASLTFTPANWSTYQTVALTAAEDNADNVDGIAVFAITAAGIGSAKVTATEADDDYTLTVTATNGTVAIDSGVKGSRLQPLYDYGTVVTLTATPDLSWQFVEWFDDATGPANPLKLTMDEDKAVTARFMPLAPLALPPRAIAQKSFTARWRWVDGGAPEGELCVATDPDFTNRLPGYVARYVCNITECSVTNLVTNRDYWYRVRRLATLTQLSGPSDWSKAVKVRTGVGLPVFTSLLCDASAGIGSRQEFALTNLVSGTGVMTIKSSDPDNVNVTMTTNSLFLHYLWKGTGNTARITLTAKHALTGYVASYAAVIRRAAGVVKVVKVGALTNSGKRLTQDVTLENRSGVTLFGVRLRVRNLTNETWMVNRSGLAPNTHDAIREIPCVWPAGSQMVVRVVYLADYLAQSRRRPVDYWAGAIVPPLNGVEPVTTTLSIARSAAYEDGSLWLLGMPAIGNRFYAVLQSDDSGASWTTNTPAVRTTANYLNWLDLAAGTNRLYEVKDLKK